MNYEQLAKIIFDEMKPKLENNNGLSIFARERAKFEGWLKVELCESLSKYFSDIIPENKRIDVTFDKWALQLKTINTNIRFANVENKSRPITMNTQGVIEDIRKLRKLRSINFQNKAVLFVVFPITHDNKNWQIQLTRIIKALKKEPMHVDFKFKNEVPGVIYFGLV
ncbi:MAG: hypothetical protein QXK74_07300 [Candidatus Nitrosocaldaceae archaeon]